MGTLLQKIDKERQLKQSREITVVEKMCRVYLADDQRPLELPWCKGRGFKNTIIVVRPGESVVQPLDKCHAWFGPFDRFKEYEECQDEAVLDVLRDHISIESARYLMRYDYPRGTGRGYHPDMNPSGPHRSPDVTITTLNETGDNEEPIRLYEIYGIGEFDDLKDTWAHKETEETIRMRFEERLREKDAVLEAVRREMAELKGIVIGRAESIATSAKKAPKAQPTDVFTEA